jgi:hypothetical protein
MKWTGPNQGKLRRAFLEIYGESDSGALKRFIRDNFTYSLSDIGGNSPADWAENLIEKAVAEGWISELYLKVCQNNQNHSAIQQLQGELLNPPLIEKTPKVDAEELFADFSPRYDFAAVQASFLRACKETISDFWEMRPDHPPLTDLSQIQTLIESYKPELAIRFVEHVMVEFKGDGRDLTAVAQWRDRTTSQYNIPLTPLPSTQEGQQGYLLVSLKDGGKTTGNTDFVTVFAELHVTCEKAPIKFSNTTQVTCSLDQVAGYLSDWIDQAEECLSNAYGIGRITLELFLPWKHLDIDVARWEVSNSRDQTYALGDYRSFLIRSFDRANEEPTKKEVHRKWAFLQDCVRNNDACDRFHLQDTHPTAGKLLKALKNKPGLKLLAECPEDRDDYLAILDAIIDSAVPMALWFCALEEISAADKLTAFDSLLKSCCGDLTDFSKLADQRENSSLAEMEHFRLLCDRPDRWPTLPSSQSDPLMTP